MSILNIIIIIFVTLLCQTWNLELTPGKRIKLTFDSFDLEDHASCEYDYVRISYGSFDEKYCGPNKPSPIISSGNTMTVLFHSDGSETFKGFKTTWEAGKNINQKVLRLYLIFNYYIITILSRWLHRLLRSEKEYCSVLWSGRRLHSPEPRGHL